MYIGDQFVFVGICDGYGLIFGIEGGDGCDWVKGFFMENLCFGWDIGQYGGLIEQWFLWIVVVVGQQLGVVCQCIGDLFFLFFDGGFVYQGVKVVVFDVGVQCQGVGGFGELGVEVVIDVVFDQKVVCVQIILF